MKLFTHRRATTIVLSGLTLAAVTLSGCASTRPTGQTALRTTGTNPTQSPGGQQTPTPRSTPTNTTTTPGTSVTTSTIPTLLVFTVKQKPECPGIRKSGAPFIPTPQDIILDWEITGPATDITGVTLSIDDPGFYQMNHQGSYDTYPGKSGTLQFGFRCDATAGPTQTHIYSLYTVGGANVLEQTLTVTAITDP